jgi:hypothetical protein
VSPRSKSHAATPISLVKSTSAPNRSLECEGNCAVVPQQLKSGDRITSLPKNDRTLRVPRFLSERHSFRMHRPRRCWVGPRKYETSEPVPCRMAWARLLSKVDDVDSSRLMNQGFAASYPLGARPATLAA